MKATEMRDAAAEKAADLSGTARKAAKDLFKGAKKAAYAVVGAPVVVGRQIAGYGTKVGSTLRQEIEAYIEEGEALTEKLRDRSVVDEIKDRMDIDQLQDRVERLRDQLEDVLVNWRETFRPESEAAPEETTKPAATAKKTGAKPASTTKPAAKKPAAAAKKPATK